MTDRTLEHLPRIDIVAMGRATRVPDWYGDAVDDSFDVRCFVIHHPDGPIVIDAGIGRGNAFIEQIYAPETVDIGDALTSCEVDLAQVQARWRSSHRRAPRIVPRRNCHAANAALRF